MASSFKSRAAKLGREHGVNAAGWWLQDMPTGGRSSASESEARAWAVETLRRIEACDDIGMPHSDMSGEWADGMTQQRLADEIGYDVMRDKREGCGFLHSDLCDAYERGFSEACEREIVRTLKMHAKASR